MPLAAVVNFLWRLWISLGVPVTAMVFWPVIGICYLHPRLRSAWYSISFFIGDHLFLRKWDREPKSHLFARLPRDYKDGESKVLEIGPGTGGNFAYYPQPRFALQTLEFHPALKSLADSLKKRFPNIIITDSLIGDAQSVPQIPDESYDIVIGTHILCCIPDPSAAAREIYRILKPVRANLR